MAYIDTKYLEKCETCRHCKGEIKCDTYCDHGEQYIPDMSKIPTAYVVEVRHGEWIVREEGGYWHYDWPFCDDGFVIKMKMPTPPNYCENCGAKMDGGKNENV